jgi:hypothetical protein
MLSLPKENVYNVMVKLHLVAEEDAMPQTLIHQCQCLHCIGETPHPDQVIHRQMNVLLSRLNEQQRRWYAALEATRIGHGGDRLISQITGLDPQTICRGRRELDADLHEVSPERVRAPGAGRPHAEKKTR